MNRETILSPDRVYRYALWRVIDPQNPLYTLFIGLNPSTADETLDDPTIRRCQRFAQEWGSGALCMVNLFAFRATDPETMKRATDPIGPENDAYLFRLIKGASEVIAAWGNHGTFKGRDREVNERFGPFRCLGINGNGTPKHPLYLKATTKPEAFNW